MYTLLEKKKTIDLKEFAQLCSNLSILLSKIVTEYHRASPVSYWVKILLTQLIIIQFFELDCKKVIFPGPSISICCL